MGRCNVNPMNFCAAFKNKNKTKVPPAVEFFKSIYTAPTNERHSDPRKKTGATYLRTYSYTSLAHCRCVPTRITLNSSWTLEAKVDETGCRVPAAASTARRSRLDFIEDDIFRCILKYTRYTRSTGNVAYWRFTARSRGDTVVAVSTPHAVHSPYKDGEATTVNFSHFRAKNTWTPKDVTPLPSPVPGSGHTRK